MTTNTAAIKNPSISVKPSQKCIDYIKKVDVTKGLPIGISNIVFKNAVKSTNVKPIEVSPLLTSEDIDFIKTFQSDKKVTFSQLPLSSTSDNKIESSEKLLSLQDLHWLYNYLQKNNKKSEKKVYLHELIEGSEIILPKNQEVPRNPELESRCKTLRAQQQNRAYHEMTKNVDNVRKKYPEDTLAFQSKYKLKKNLYFYS